MSEIIKVPNTSDFWKDNENHNWYFAVHWDSESAKAYLSQNQVSFIYKYALITLKYGILVPNFDRFDNLHEQIVTLLSSYETVFTKEWIPMNINRLYSTGDTLLCASILYIQKDSKITAERIANIELLENYETVMHRSSFFAYPIDFCFFRTYIYLTIQNDVFYSKLWNSKTHIDAVAHGYYVDNSDLVWLNAPRLNSFLRDFKILCFEFGATHFVSEIYDDFYKDIFSEEGVFINNEIIFYEDIYHLIPENLQYKEFENIIVELDDTNYRNYLDNRANS